MHRLYENGDISVFWDSDKCRHAKECVNGCPEAFNIMRKPWIDISKAPTAKVWQAVSRCPSGALTCIYNHEVRIEYDRENLRSVAFYADKKIGECDYEENENIWIIYHTEVDERYTGKGIAKRLVYKLIQEAERSNKAIDATCSYAAKILGE
ncbi:MAG: GNAT family N-acetyltransferase [Lachnospiraceae bacterium]|nr:GNAT family N-acetyltransferase [Lachnospiraceae bacterium]